jgi:hypothetical protein
MFRDPAARERMGSAALDYARSQTWTQRTGELMRIYEQLAGAPSSVRASDNLSPGSGAFSLDRR